MQSPSLGLPYIAPNQAQKHVTYNDAIRRLDAVVQAVAESRSQQAPPSSVSEGALFIPASGASGEWAGWDQEFAAFQDGGWHRITPQVGWRLWVKDENALLAYNGTVWTEFQGSNNSSGSLEQGELLGINATADLHNRLNVTSPSILFNAESDDIGLTLNKRTVGDDARIAFETAFSTRALIGLLGDNKFGITVSGNGSTYKQAIVVDNNGLVGIGGSPSRALHIRASGGLNGIRLTDSTDTNGYIIRPNVSSTADFGLAIEQADGTDIAWFRRGLYVGTPTGLDRGPGTINAEAIFDDNALLSCYVFDQALDNSVDFEKWDKRVPDRIWPTGGSANSPKSKETRTHEPMRKFCKRIGTNYDPLTLDGYARHWREMRHLPSMPNEDKFDPNIGLSTGEWLQRLIETVEIQAVLIEALNKRLKTLEPQ